VTVNVASFDAAKHAGIAVVADARAALEDLTGSLTGATTGAAYRAEIADARSNWASTVEAAYHFANVPLPSQIEVVAAVNDAAAPGDVVVCAAGSMPGDLHKLWRTGGDPKSYHVEYGYSCMGYEIAGGLGVKLAAPERDVYVLVGDGSYLMMAQEIVTSIAERAKLTIVLVDNQGFSSIGSLSRSVGSDGFGTLYRYRVDGSLGTDGDDSGAALPVDLAANAASLGARVFRSTSVEELREALAAARDVEETVVIHIEVDRYEGVPSYESWWDVPVAEVSDVDDVRDARAEYERARRRQRPRR
jgi:3D-(3,5/4)-trihydroxycyclohexane-1,2-dione acylhydrolase (decyclizing)